MAIFLLMPVDNSEVSTILSKTFGGFAHMLRNEFQRCKCHKIWLKTPIISLMLVDIWVVSTIMSKTFGWFTHATWQLSGCQNSFITQFFRVKPIKPFLLMLFVASRQVSCKCKKWCLRSVIWWALVLLFSKLAHFLTSFFSSQSEVIDKYPMLKESDIWKAFCQGYCMQTRVQIVSHKAENMGL